MILTLAMSTLGSKTKNNEQREGSPVKHTLQSHPIPLRYISNSIYFFLNTFLLKHAYLFSDLGLQYMKVYTNYNYIKTSKQKFCFYLLEPCGHRNFFKFSLYLYIDTFVAEEHNRLDNEGLARVELNSLKLHALWKVE